MQVNNYSWYSSSLGIEAMLRPMSSQNTHKNNVRGHGESLQMRMRGKMLSSVASLEMSSPSRLRILGLTTSDSEAWAIVSCTSA